MNPSDFFTAESICQCMFRPCFSYKNQVHLLHLRLCPLQKGMNDLEIISQSTVLSSYPNFGRFPLASCLMKETWTNSNIAMWITSKQRLDLPPHPLTAAYTGLVRDAVLKMYKHVIILVVGGSSNIEVVIQPVLSSIAWEGMDQHLDVSTRLQQTYHDL